MRLISFTKGVSTTDTLPRFGALLAEGKLVLDFQAAFAVTGEVEPAAPGAFREWFDLDQPWLMKARALVEQFTGDDERLQASGVVLERTEVHLLAPVPRPGKIIAIGLNYRDHAIESNMPIPTSPVVFSKFTTSITGPDQPVIIPATSAKVDYEAELAVIIGRRAKHVARAQAYDYVLGYANLNDVSARDFQFADGQWQRGKSCDTFSPLGQYIATTDEIADPQNLAIKLRLNGQTMQNSSTKQLIFGVPELIAFLSETITLEPGDVIATGTPPGVGFARNPPVFLKHGDVMEVEIEGLGVLSNPVVAETGVVD